MKPVLSPNLPSSRVKAALIGCDTDKEIILSLEGQGIEPVLVPECADLPLPLRSHADMLCYHMGGGNILLYQGVEKALGTRLAELGFKVAISSARLDACYPGDAALNAARVEGRIFCNPSTISREILVIISESDLTLIPVRQGYARCSICAVDKSSVITSDSGIADAAEENGLDVLRIRPGYIKLSGYAYGFIGGACGKCASDRLCFAGRIEGHPDYESIRSFCAHRGVEAVSLSSCDLTDIGGILPLTQEET
ncbi:MAG: hypothetical protein P4M02_11560 [Clostridia bacterium]|nr:hypothetical protein [Clostridia bacterium]